MVQTKQEPPHKNKNKESVTDGQKRHEALCLEALFPSAYSCETRRPKVTSAFLLSQQFIIWPNQAHKPWFIFLLLSLSA